MFAKYKRDKFCSILDKYWSRFAANWDVLLHGSPAVDMYGGMKLAAGGELGMGVGEEDWGSSERDVLEDFARRTEGLVDVMVSRFGEASPLQQANFSTDPKHLHMSEVEPWIGAGRNVEAVDGVVFSGLGAVSRKSLRDLSHWTETIYSLGDQAYGIRDNPTSNRRRRKRRILKSPSSPPPEARKPIPRDRSQLAASNLDTGLPPGIPPPIVKAAENSLEKASAAAERGGRGTSQEQKPLLASLGDTETWMKYMTLGYGTAWGGKKPVEEAQPASKPDPPRRTPSPEAMRYIDPEPDVDLAEEKIKQQIRQENDGYFMIGLKGDMYDVDVDDENDDDWNHRIPLRTVHVEVNQRDDVSLSPSGDSDETPAYERELSLVTRVPTGLSRLRPVVYVVCESSPLTIINTDPHSTDPSSTPSSSITAPALSASRPSTATSTTSSPRSTGPWTKTPAQKKSPRAYSPPPIHTPPPPPPRPPPQNQTPNPSTTSFTTPALSPYTPASPTSLTQGLYSPKASEPHLVDGHASSPSTSTHKSYPPSPTPG
jgi:hypothetical protein